MLSSQWSDAQFSLSSLNDRQPVQSDDELVVVACPDPQGVAEVRKIADALMREPSEESGASVAGLGRPLVLFNPRLASGDVGIGLSVRRLRSEFLAFSLQKGSSKGRFQEPFKGRYDHGFP